MSNLHAIDLNLLLSFDALLEEGSVTKAAKRVGVSQPAMSNALGRLRRSIGDELLVRTKTGMVPTPRALELAGPVREALSTLERALEDRGSFDAATAERKFVLATNDYAEMVLLPALALHCAKYAPGVDLSVRALGDLPSSALESGEVDLALGVFQDIPGSLRQQGLFKDRFVCVARKDHPEVQGTLSLEQYARQTHVLISPRGKGPGVVDHVLAQQQLQRRVAVSVPHFSVAPLLVAQTDHVLTLASRVACAFGAALGLQVLEPPLDLPHFTIRQVWHQRFQQDAAHAWLRRCLAEIAQSVAEPGACLNEEST